MTQNLNSGFSDAKTFTMAERDFRQNLSYLRSISSVYPTDGASFVWNDSQKQYIPQQISGTTIERIWWGS